MRRPWSTASLGRLIAAVAIVALGTGALYLATGQSPSPAPTAAPAIPSPRLTRVVVQPQVRPLPALDIPPDVASGFLDTPLGRARWVHVSGDATSLPQEMVPIAWSSGWVAPDSLDRDSFGSMTRTLLWSSPDGVTWTPGPLPVPADPAGVSIAHEGGFWWITTRGPTSLWRSADTVQWDRIDLARLMSPGPAALDWEVRLGEPASTGGSTAFPVSYLGSGIGRLFGLPDDISDMQIEAGSDGTWTVRRESGDPLIVVRLEETPTGLRVTDTTGAIVGEIEGVGLEFARRWQAAGQVVEQQVGLVDGDGLTPVDLPGPALTASLDNQGRALTLLGTTGAMFAFLDEPDGTDRAWTSGDGRSWSESATTDMPEYLSDFTPEPYGIRAEGESRPWITGDGVTWDAVPRTPFGTWPDRLPTGWLAQQDGVMQVLPDGGTWSRVDLGGVTLWDTTDSAGIGGGMVLGSTSIDFSSREGGGRDVWYLDFSGTPDRSSPAPSAAHP